MSPVLMSAEAIIAELGMMRHPEGGWYAETFRDDLGGARGHSTAIYYLLGKGEVSHWHRVRDAAEVWHHYAGAPLLLQIAAEGGTVRDIALGPDILNGERPHGIVPAGHWQSARSKGDWTLVGCTVAPGFVFESFDMAPPGWTPA